MTIAAAALVVAAGVAQAQTIKAEVPFSFRAAGTVMPAGEYWVNANSTSGGTPMFKVTNRDTNRSIITMPYSASDPANYEASLTFECRGTNCALVKVAPGTGHSYQIHSPKLGGNEDTRVAVIRAVLVNGR
jgi:hypothetical protein